MDCPLACWISLVYTPIAFQRIDEIQFPSPRYAHSQILDISPSLHTLSLPLGIIFFPLFISLFLSHIASFLCL